MLGLVFWLVLDIGLLSLLGLVKFDVTIGFRLGLGLWLRLQAVSWWFEKLEPCSPFSVIAQTLHLEQ